MLVYIHLGSGLSDPYPEIVGKYDAGHAASRNTQQLIGFYSTHSLVAVQTWRPEQVMSVEENWSTWFRRSSKKHHLKDLILIPADDKAKVSVCSPSTLLYKMIIDWYCVDSWCQL